MKTNKPISVKNKTFTISEKDIRFAIVFLTIFILFLYLGINIWKLQISESENFKNIKQDQHRESVLGAGDRGDIFATRKDGVLVPMANTIEGYKLVISPKNIPDYYEARIISLIPPSVDLESRNFKIKVAKKTDPYEDLGEISKVEAENIENLSLVGVYVEKFKKRNYPLGIVGAKVIGFVGDGEDGVMGRAGLEKYYNDILSSNNTQINNFFSKVFAELNGKTENNTKLSENLVITLEPNVSNYLNSLLQDMKETWQSDVVAGIIMNSKTGEIIAMEGIPTFNPNNYKDFEASNYVNQNVQGVYEMGSIVKPITIGLGIQNKLITPESYFRDTGFVELDGYTIQNFDRKARGDVTMSTVLGESLNTGVVYIIKLLGKDRFREGLEKFGAEEETGIDLPGELSNKTMNLHSGPLVNYATASFGQGIAFTPISMLRILNSIQNEGELVNPYIVKKKIDIQGNEIEMSGGETKIATDKETADTVKKMLINNIDKYYAKGKYKDKNYAVGAKTGTAQLTKERGGYYDDRFLHSYFMFLGSGDNSYSVLLFQVNPKSGVLASIALTPYANKLKDFLITYYGIQPDRQM